MAFDKGQQVFRVETRHQHDLLGKLTRAEAVLVRGGMVKWARNDRADAGPEGEELTPATPGAR